MALPVRLLRFMGLPLKNEFIHDLPEAKNIVEESGYVNLQINDPDLCARYTAFRIKDVKIGPSPFWMQQRLRQCGMRPINNIVDITNYVMLELGQPLHAFDYEALVQRSSGTPNICVRRAQPGEVLVTLDEVERKLDPEMLLITDEQGAIAIAGIMGGGNTEVSEATTDILLEAAHFEFLNNRRTSQLLKLKTEAAERFGKRLDPELPLLAGWRAARLIAELAGGTLEPVVGDLYPKNLNQSALNCTLTILSVSWESSCQRLRLCGFLRHWSSKLLSSKESIRFRFPLIVRMCGFQQI